MKRKSITLAVLFSSLLVAGIFLFNGARGANFITPVRAQEFERAAQFNRGGIRHCTIGTITGNYAYQASGFITQPIPQLQIPAGPFAVNSLLSLSVGSFTFKGTQSFNGTLVPANGAGTYTVNDDCTGAGVDQNGIPYNFVIADDGEEIRIILGVPNTVVTGIAKRL